MPQSKSEPPSTTQKPFNRDTLRERDWEFQEHVMKALEVLRKIANGKTTRGRCLKGQWQPGERPLKMAEVQRMAENAQFQLNAAIVQFHKTEPQPWDWERFEKQDH